MIEDGLIADGVISDGALQETQSTCPYCGVGCGVIIGTAIPSAGGQRRVIQVRGDPEHPANYGRLCSKGTTLHQTMTPDILRHARALNPEIRVRKDQQRAPVDWDTAIDHVALKFAQTIAQYGPNSVAFYLSGQMLTEDYYVFNKIAKGLIRTNNVDTNSRLCMSSAVAGYKQTLGADAPPTCYEDIDHASCLFIAGSNTAWAHPIVYRRIEAARVNNPALKIIVIDPRQTETAAAADLFLPIFPGTDVALYHSMLHVMLWERWIKQDYIDQHTNGFEALRTLAREYPPEHAAKICGIAPEKIVEAARLFATSSATLSMYCQGLNQSTSGTNNNAALINLHLVSGQIGKPGAGPFSLTGQPNAMGGREVGGLSNLLPAHRDLSVAKDREDTARFWGVPDVCGVPGKTAVELFDALHDGSIKAVWIVCTNPAQSLPNLNRVHEALRKAPFVVLQEAYRTTATVPFADVLLPASSWAEKEGTVTNSERCVTRVRKAVDAPGAAKPDWWIAVTFAQRLEKQLALLGIAPRSESSLFAFESAHDVWLEHRESTRATDCDITGMSYAGLERKPAQWPMREGETSGKLRLYEDGQFCTPDGRARLIATPFKETSEKINVDYPFALNTGRLRDQWHGMSRTGGVPQLFGHAPAPAIEMHPLDMERRRVVDGALVSVQSRRGQVTVRAQANPALRSGQVFMAMHWGAEYLAGRDAAGQVSVGVNTLTQDAFDPFSKQPELKHAVVKITPILDAMVPLVAIAWVGHRRVEAIREQLRSLTSNLPYAELTPFGRDQIGMYLRCYKSTAFTADDLNRIDMAMGMGATDFLRVDDARRSVSKRLLIEQDRLKYLLLAGDISSEPWLANLLQSQVSVAALGRQILMPGAQAPKGVLPTGKLVCTCFGVTEKQISDHLNLPTPSGLPNASLSINISERIKSVQDALRCGTNCGSCLPQLRQLCANTVQA